MSSSFCSLAAGGRLSAVPSASRPRGRGGRRPPLFPSRLSRDPAIPNVNQWHPASRILTFLTATTFILFPPPLDPIPSILPPLDAPIANARGLFQMPPSRLVNRYFLVRAGESETEHLGLIRTNPVEKTSVDSGLSEEGKKQAVESAFELKKMGACDGNCWIWPSITQRSYQAAEIIAAVNSISRSHIVPEYSFLDARGLGAYEGKKLDVVNEVYDSDRISPSTKPPPIDDGTPNESVEDVFVRVTQLMSILETQYAGDSIVIVSPDSDNLSVLQAGLVGLDLRRHMDLSFVPGEVRRVDVESIPAYRQPASAVYKCLNPPSCR